MILIRTRLSASSHLVEFISYYILQIQALWEVNIGGHSLAHKKTLLLQYYVVTYAQTKCNHKKINFLSLQNTRPAFPL
jgi:hypothetical protein